MSGVGANTTGNVSLDVKYIFISFAQQFFATHSKYTWNQDPKLTKIVIADKNAVDLEVVEVRPSIIVARGNMAWTNTNPGQKAPDPAFFTAKGTQTLEGDGYTADLIKNSTYTDLLQSSVTMHVLSKSGIQAEEIASDIFSALTVYKEDLRKRGVHKVLNLSFGEEQLLRSNAAIEYSSVPIAISFLMQKTIRRGEIANNCKVYIDGKQVHEGIHFKVESNGTVIHFMNPPKAASSVTITYVDAQTIVTSTNVTLTPQGGSVNGVETYFNVPNSGMILGYYSLLKALEFTAPESDIITASGGYVSGIWFRGENDD